MLKEIRIHRFGPLRNIVFRPHPGWTVVTGSSGTGKSLLVETIEFVAGTRIRPRWKLAGEPLEVECVVTIPEHPIFHRLMKETGIFPEDGELILRRRLDEKGKGSIWIQGRRSTATVVQKWMKRLVDFSSQWAVARFFTPKQFKQWIDMYGGHETEVRELKRIAQELRKYQKLLLKHPSLQELDENVRYYQQQAHELESAELQEGEIDELHQELKILSQSEQYRHDAQEALLLLQEEGGVFELMERIRKILDRLSEDIEEFKSYPEQLTEIKQILEALSFDLTQFEERISSDPDRLIAVEERLRFLEGLERKYGRPLHELLRYYAFLKKEIDRLKETRNHLREAHQNISELYGQYIELNLELFQKRKETSLELANRIQALLHELGLTKARCHFKWSMEHIPSECPRESPIPLSGFDSVQFLIQVRPEQPLAPVHQVCSGGELSRIYLAFKAVVGEQPWSRTVILDEVELGLGGEILDAVGDIFEQISTYDQLLVVTHWPQLAIRAHDHWSVRVLESERPSLVHLETPQERVKELLRMYGQKGTGVDEKRLFHVLKQYQKLNT